MRILALDPSSQNTGFAVMQIERNAPHIVKSGSISHPKPRKVTYEDKCRFIFMVVKNQLLEWQPDLVVIEYPFVGRNAKTAVQLGRLCGMLEATCQIMGYSYMTVMPTVWKAAFAGSGGADKNQVYDMVDMQYGIKAGSHDESDAIGIGTYYLDYYLYQQAIEKGT